MFQVVDGILHHLGEFGDAWFHFECACIQTAPDDDWFLFSLGWQYGTISTCLLHRDGCIPRLVIDTHSWTFIHRKTIFKEQLRNSTDLRVVNRSASSELECHGRTRPAVWEQE